MQASELFWEVPLADLKQGFTFDKETDAYVCLACGERFSRGIIYPSNGVLYEAGKFAEIHIGELHGSMFEFLLGLDKKLTGLTELQKRLMELFYSGMSDGDIVKELGGGSASTIRNHRFTLRERMKQAKVFLAIMELAEQRTTRNSRLIPIHRTATMVDQRYEITEKDNDDMLKSYFPQGPDGPLSEFPKKEKRKIIILRHLARQFDEKRQYTEKEVNAVLKERFADYVTLRRYLIEYGFMDRLPDGSRYWIKK
jgi:hypothetical protein